MYLFVIVVFVVIVIIVIVFPAAEANVHYAQPFMH